MNRRDFWSTLAVSPLLASGLVMSGASAASSSMNAGGVSKLALRYEDRFVALDGKPIGGATPIIDMQ